MAGETLGEEAIAHTETGSGMPQLDFSNYPNMIFWLIVSLVAIYFILTKVALPRIATALADRNDAISDAIEEAALFKRRAEEAEADYNLALAKARDEAQKIAAETRAKIDADLAMVLAKADAEIAAKSAESERRIRDIQESATRSVDEVARSTAGAIVEALLPTAFDEGAVAAAVANRMKG